MKSLVGVLVLASVASAQPAPDLTKEFQAGVDAFRLGKFDEARTHLEKARELDPKLPGPHRFLAAVAQAQGRWQDCLDEARIALALNPRSSESADTRKLHGECRTSAGRAAYSGPDLVDGAAVAVTTNVPGATVKIGGLTYGGTPLAPRPITPGKLEIDIDKPGWKPSHVEIDAPAGIVTDVAVDMEPDPNAKVTPDDNGKPVKVPDIGWLVPPTIGSMTIDGKPATGKEIELAPGPHEVEVRVEAHDPWRRRVRISAGQRVVVHPELVVTSEREHTEAIGFVFLAGGGALLAAGFASTLVSEHAADDAREIQRVETLRDPSAPGYDVEPKHTRADFDAARNRASTFSVMSDVAYGAALVSIGVGAYYLYKGARVRSDAPPPFAIAPVRGGAFVAKEIRW
jgi:hypothetical protein